jgi:hypothetical protein
MSLPLNTPRISPSQAVQYPQSGNGNIPLLPIPASSYKYFQTAIDAQLVRVALDAAFSVFLSNQQNGSGGVTGITSSIPECPYIASLTGETQPVFIYYDLVFQVYVISYSITFQVPLPPNSPGPFNKPTTITGTLAIGDIGGNPGTGIVVTYQSGNLSFSWKP